MSAKTIDSSRLVSSTEQAAASRDASSATRDDLRPVAHAASPRRRARLGGPGAPIAIVGLRVPRAVRRWPSRACDAPCKLAVSINPPDLFSRKVVGWSLGDRLDAELSGEAL
jgi:hypothetical protein